LLGKYCFALSGQIGMIRILKPKWSKSFFIKIRLVTTCLIFGLWLSGCQASNNQSPFETAQEKVANDLYEEAWKSIQVDYVDHTYNGQNWLKWKNHYQNRIHDLDDAYVAIDTMVSSLNDEYTRFLKPRDMNEQSLSIDSRLFGVGIQISMHHKKLVVLSTLDDTPAARAGIMPKDIITSINGKETAGITVAQAADQIRGKKGSFVTLSIQRNQQHLVKKIMRDEIKIKSVFTRPIKDNRIGYLRLSSFISESMMGEIQTLVKQLANKQALIVDIRGNYGGLFSNAVEIADMFLRQGDIVSIVNREHDRQRFSAHPPQEFLQPVVLLVDGGSASASEILSGALKDNHRATLVGADTFGKGLVQKINPLSHEAGINITVSRYLTPNGDDINKKGIVPDIKVPITERDILSGEDPQLEKAIQVLQSKLDKSS
jgi:carboxyl-terminal processing protease